MMEQIHFLRDKIIRQKVASSKWPIGLPYGVSICRLLESLDIPTLGLQVLPPAEKPLDHVSLLRAHLCRHQGIWVHAATLTKAQVASASKETMAAALESSLPALADATTAAEETAAAATEAAAAATVVATAAAAAVEDDLEDPIDDVLASTLEGINLALSMDNPLGFPAISPISRESETQGEPPQVSVLSSPLSQGEQPSRVSPMASPAHVNSYMDMLFGSKTPRCSDPPERP